jgi:hypothetical protein
MESIEELAGKLKGDVVRWEEEILNWAYELAQSVTKVLLEKIDEELMKGREEGLKVEGLKERGVTTLFGEVRIRRRLYRDSEGHSRFLLDEAIGLRKRSQASPKVEELATFLCSHLPFEKCERLLRALLPDGISHTTIHRLVGRVVDPQLEEEEKEIAELFQDGVIPESEGRVVSHLMVEADGASIALQREEERRTEVKVGIAYEGWQPVGKERYKLKGKISYTGIMEGERFWEGFSLALAKKYDLSQVGQVIVGSDGAGWARAGVDLLGGIFQLDRFHLLRALHRGAGEELAREAYRACVAGDVAEADTLLRQAQESSRGESARRIAQLRGYLLNNSPGLRDYRVEVGYDGLRGLGAIEGNVDKLIANRMKKRGMSWTKRGGNRMARLINLRETGQLHLWVNRREKQDIFQTIPVSVKVTWEKGRCTDRDHGAWLEAGLPSLYGPHANRPWARVLRAIAHGTGGIT